MRTEVVRRSSPAGAGQLRRLIRRHLAGSLLVPALEAATGFRTPHGDPLWFRWAMLTGRYERRTRQLMGRVIRPGAVAFDVGAHVGYHTAFLAACVGPQGTVVAVEPHPEHLALLRANVRRCPNVTVVAAAASDKNGYATLHDYKVESGSSSLYPGPDGKASGAGRRDPWAPRRPRRFRVPTIRLDTFVEEHAIPRPDFVKLDVEGSEIPALVSLDCLLRQRPVSLLLELNLQTVQASGREPLDLIRMLQDLGFHSARVIDDFRGTDWLIMLDQAERLVEVVAANARHLNLLCEK